MEKLIPEDFKIETLGECNIMNPLAFSSLRENNPNFFVSDSEHILYDVYYNTKTYNKDDPVLKLEKAGPREKIFFDPSKVHAGIVTCGGLCPGLNNVIRAIVRTLWSNYKVTKVTGIPYGYQGFWGKEKNNFIPLTPEIVDDVHKEGGTILGTSRGGSNPKEIVDSIIKMNMNILFAIGGDGTQRGALSIAEEAQKRGYLLSVVGIPKTVDNDLSFVQQSFGFVTAVEIAVECVAGAHAEAKSLQNGISIVKVMGRHSGFIAAHTALASTDVNFCLIPEIDFSLEGENGLLASLEKRILAKQHLVLIVAEGAGQDLLEDALNDEKKDASGNIVLKDIGLFLKEKIQDFFERRNIPVSIKYINPSYVIRSVPANSRDSLYCSRLGANAVHAAISGRSKVLISLWSNKFVHVPIDLATQQRNIIKIQGSFWRDVVSMTGQPARMKF